MKKATQFIRAEAEDRQWHLIDATGIPVGRISTRAAMLLMGKHKPSYTPNFDCGDGVVIINVEKVTFTGNKWEQKKYYRHTGYPGGLKTETAAKRLKTHPERILMDSVYGMLPKTKIGKKQLTHLRVYAGPEHGQKAQKLQKVEF